MGDTKVHTIEQARAWANLHGARFGRTSFYQAVRRGDIPSVRIGQKVFISEEALRRVLGLYREVG